MNRREDLDLPIIIQGGMGIGVSSAPMACAVANTGQLGVVSGTAIDSVLARKLQDGDSSGEIRWALSKFPDQETVAEVLERFFAPGGRADDKSYLDVVQVPSPW